MGVANFCIATEKSDEVDFVLVHGFVSVLLNSRVLLGSHLGEASEGAGAQGGSSAFAEGPERSCHCALRKRSGPETVTRRAMQSKQESKPPPGAGNAPKP